jgi:hypothetical protein
MNTGVAIPSPYLLFVTSCNCENFKKYWWASVYDLNIFSIKWSTETSFKRWLPKWRRHYLSVRIPPKIALPIYIMITSNFCEITYCTDSCLSSFGFNQLNRSFVLHFLTFTALIFILVLDIFVFVDLLFIFLHYDGILYESFE